MATALKTPEGPSIHDKAREALRKARGAGTERWTNAAKMFRRWLDNDTKLYKELAEPMIDKAIWAAIRAAAYADRVTIIGSVKSPGRFEWPEGKPDRAAKDGTLALVAETHLMMFPLQGGLVLGDATRPEVQETRELYEKMAAGNAVKGRWLALVCSKLPSDTKTVAKQLKEEDLRKLWTRAEESK